MLSRVGLGQILVGLGWVRSAPFSARVNPLEGLRNSKRKVPQLSFWVPIYLMSEDGPKNLPRRWILLIFTCELEKGRVDGRVSLSRFYLFLDDIITLRGWNDSIDQVRIRAAL